jgi:hypothetical protein
MKEMWMPQCAKVLRVLMRSAVRGVLLSPTVPSTEKRHLGRRIVEFFFRCPAPN